MTRHLSRRPQARRARRALAVGALATAALAGAAGAALSSLREDAARAAQPTLVTPTAKGISPQMLREAYGVTPLLRRGIDGRGETIVVPTFGYERAAGQSNIHKSLRAFDAEHHLPGVDLVVRRAFGFTGDPALAQAEEVLDVETVHAIAPAARIVVVQSGPRSFTPPGLGRLLGDAITRGNIVSLSYDECERCLTTGQRASLHRVMQRARDRHVTVMAVTGDFGAASGGSVDAPSSTRGVSAPASSPLVTAVGGTTLALHRDGAYGTETAWNEKGLDYLPPSEARYVATGGGFSARYPRPAYQAGLPVIGDRRGVPDVSATGEPGLRLTFDGGLQIVFRHGKPVVVPGRKVHRPGGETSEAAPFWAAITALADQDAHRQLGFLNEGLYRIGRGAQAGRAFHDVTEGDNTVTLPSGKRIQGYRARPGWDPVTGWGSPNAQVLVPLLAREVRPDDGRGL